MNIDAQRTIRVCELRCYEKGRKNFVQIQIYMVFTPLCILSIEHLFYGIKFIVINKSQFVFLFLFFIYNINYDL